jgi:tRNA A-37 threonylcarbamoyl transferase component Bud32
MEALVEDDLHYIYEASLDHQIPRKPFDKHINETVYLEVEGRLCAREQVPGYWTPSSIHWSKNVRLYTLLRMLGYREGSQVFGRFESEEIGDFWLPLTLPTLKQLFSVPGFDFSGFMNAQRHVMSDSKQMNEQNLIIPFFERQYVPGSRSRTHRYLEIAKSHFTDFDEIGKGASARVLRIQHKLSGKEFACKRLCRARNLGAQRSQLKKFEQEVKVLQGIRHRHIVSLVASFTDHENFALILDPIADYTLLEVLRRKQPLSEEETAMLCCSFNCLATALGFLHASSVRHKDIKPSNVLLSEGRVLLCDFGISLEWTEAENGTTEEIHPSFTRRYAAPEVFRETHRNSKTDIWSLGCVFLETFSAIKGYAFDDINVKECIEGQGLSSTGMKNWLHSIEDVRADAIYDLPIEWATAMVCAYRGW